MIQRLVKTVYIMVNGNRRSARNRQSSSKPVSRAAFDALKARLNPDIKAVSCSGQPRPVVGASDFWISRRVQIVKSATAGTVVSLVAGDLVKELSSAAGTYPIRINTVTVWGSLNSVVTATLNTQNISVSATELPITASDYGSAMKVAGVKFMVPKLLSKVLQVNSASTLVVGSASWVNSVGGTTQNVVFDVDLTFQLP